MRLTYTLALTLLSSLSLASPIHQHNLHKRDADIVTQVVTQVITRTVDGSSSTASIAPVIGEAEVLSASESSSNSAFTSSSPSNDISSASDDTFSSSSTIQTSEPVPSSSSTTTLLSSSSETPTISSSSSGTASSKTSSSTSTSTELAFAKGGKGITYSPYTNSGTCKDSATIQSDIALLSQFDVIRLYDTDCSGVENVLAAKTSSQTLFAGIYYIDKISASVEIISNAVNDVDGGWDNIYAVSIGNELVNSGTNTVSDIKSAVESTRSALTSAGYSGDVVSVDTLVAVQNNPLLCDYSDFIAVNSHPYWDGSVTADEAGSWLKTQISNIKSICGGSKSVLITETGWPTKGDSYGSAVPSIANQKTAVESIVSNVGDQVILFTTYNDLWKSAGDYGVEQYWGLIQD